MSSPSERFTRSRLTHAVDAMNDRYVTVTGAAVDELAQVQESTRELLSTLSGVDATEGAYEGAEGAMEGLREETEDKSEWIHTLVLASLKDEREQSWASNGDTVCALEDIANKIQELIEVWRTR